MRKRDTKIVNYLTDELKEFHEQHQKLPGIFPDSQLRTLVEQMVDSIRRVRYVSVVRKKTLSPLRMDPNSELFDPLKASMLHQEHGDIEEACWLVFLFVHFGKGSRGGWRLIRDSYGALGARSYWTWLKTSRDTSKFREWLGANQLTLQGRDGIVRRFGNHRKYESLDAHSPAGTASVVESYVAWVKSAGTHEQLIQQAVKKGAGDAGKAFDLLYNSMNSVRRFGRTARFDYLTMLGKLELADIKPGVAYLNGATGPLKGARLLFGGSTLAKISAASLEGWLVELDKSLNVGMQVLEDSLCNWQKSPGRFIPFRG